MGEAWRLLAHKCPPIGRNGGIPHAQVAAATVDTAMHTPLMRAAVVVTNAFGGGAAELVELFKILGQGGVSQIAGWVTAQSAELIVRGLKAGVEEGRVKVISVDT